MPVSAKRQAFRFYSTLILLFYSTFVKCFGVFSCILHVLIISYGKVVCSAEVFFCTHIQILVMYMVQYSIYACDRRNTYRTRRQTWVTVGVVRTLYESHICVNAVQVKLL